MRGCWSHGGPRGLRDLLRRGALGLEPEAVHARMEGWGRELWVQQCWDAKQCLNIIYPELPAVTMYCYSRILYVLSKGRRLRGLEGLHPPRALPGRALAPGAAGLEAGPREGARWARRREENYPNNREWYET